LLKNQERDKISKLVKKQITLNYIVDFDFDNVPVYGKYLKNIMYFINHLDHIDNCS